MERKSFHTNGNAYALIQEGRVLGERISPMDQDQLSSTDHDEGSRGRHVHNRKRGNDKNGEDLRKGGVEQQLIFGKKITDPL